MAHRRSAGMARMVETITCENAKMRMRRIAGMGGLLAVQTVFADSHYDCRWGGHPSRSSPPIDTGQE